MYLTRNLKVVSSYPGLTTVLCPWTEAHYSSCASQSTRQYKWVPSSAIVPCRGGGGVTDSHLLNSAVSIAGRMNYLARERITLLLFWRLPTEPCNASEEDKGTGSNPRWYLEQGHWMEMIWQLHWQLSQNAILWRASIIHTCIRILVIASWCNPLARDIMRKKSG